MIELLVVVAIMGVLAAVAIPAYQSYQDNAREGVLDSASRHAARTVQIQQSLGKETTGDILGIRVKSKIDLEFKVSGAAADKIDATETSWCIEVKTNDGAYEGNRGCIDEGGTTHSVVGATAGIASGTGAGKTTCKSTGACGT